jgi:hypothetical protein
MTHRLSYPMIIGLSVLAGLVTTHYADAITTGLVASLLAFGLLSLIHYRGYRDAMHVHIKDCEANSKKAMEMLTQRVVSDMPAAAEISKAEQNLLHSLHKCGEDMQALGESHQGEFEEWAHHMHSLMALVYARVGVRSSVKFQALEAKAQGKEIEV